MRTVFFTGGTAQELLKYATTEEALKWYAAIIKRTVVRPLKKKQGGEEYSPPLILYLPLILKESGL